MANEKATYDSMLSFLEGLQKTAEGPQGTEEKKEDLVGSQGQEGKALSAAVKVNPNGTKVDEAPDAKKKKPNPQKDQDEGPVHGKPAGVTGVTAAGDGAADKVLKPKHEGDELPDQAMPKSASDQRIRRLAYLNDLVLKQATVELQAAPAPSTDVEKQAAAEFKALPEHLQEKIAAASCHAAKAYQDYLLGALQFDQDMELLTGKLMSEGMEKSAAVQASYTFLQKIAEVAPQALEPGAEDPTAVPQGPDAGAAGAEGAEDPAEIAKQLAAVLDAKGVSAEQFEAILGEIQKLQAEGNVSDEELYAAADQLMQEGAGTPPDKIASAGAAQPRIEKIKEYLRVVQA